MTKQLITKNLGLAGLNTDMAPWSLPQEYITSGVNFKIFAGQIISSGGYQDWSTPPTDFKAGHLRHVGSTSGDYWLIAGRSAIYSFDGETWTDVSSAAGYVGLGEDDELNWTSCMLGQIPIFNNPQHNPEYWSPQSPGQVMQSLQFDASNTWNDMGYSFNILRSHRNFLFALNLQENGVELQNAYRWSHPADINGLPFSWDENDLSSLASKEQIGGDGGVIIDGMSLRDSFVIYLETSISILDYVGGEFVFKRRELSSTVGLINKNCIVEVKGKHFFLADGDIIVNDGNNLTSLIHNKLRRHLVSRANPDFYHRSFVLKNNAVKEVWFCVPEEDAQYPNVAYIYNWRDESWSIRLLPYEVDTSGGSTITQGLAYAAYGPQADPTVTWDEWDGIWDDQTQPWGARKRTPLDDTLVGINFIDSSLLLLDPPNLTKGDIGTRIERTDFPIEGHVGNITTSRIYPHMEGTAEVKIQLGSQQRAGGPVAWKPAVLFNPANDRKVDIRTTGELLCWRIETVGTGHFRLSGMTIEYSDAGQR